MRRPTATRAARRRAASTSGSSGIAEGRSLLHDLEQLDLEHEGCTGFDLGRSPAIPVCEFRWTDELARAAHLHELKPFGPAADHAVQRKGGRFLALHRAVEDGAVDEL